MFRCKQFKVDDSLSAMKVSTDALLLGSWAKVKPSQRILDIGSGSGILTLMMLQKTAPDGWVDALDVDRNAAKQTALNIQRTSWAHRADTYNQSVIEFTADPYDVIICNPPYFEEKNSRANRSMSSDRRLARQQGELTWNVLCQRICDLSHLHTDVFIMYPHAMSQHICRTADELGLTLSKQLNVKHDKNSETYLSLFHFTRTKRSQLATVSVLAIREGQDYSPEFRELCKDFYLRF